MKLIAVDGAQSSLTVLADEVRPLRGLYLPHVFSAISERYQLTQVPTFEETQKIGAIFREGRFSTQGREINILSLGLFSDGLRAVTANTDDSDAVIDDLSRLLTEEFGFRTPTTAPIRHYQSDLVIKFDHDPSNAFQALTKFMEFASAQMPLHSAGRPPMNLSALAFGWDSGGRVDTPQFLLQRRVNVPWNLGVYFSKAHMTTSAHIRALELLDELIEQSPSEGGDESQRGTW